MDVLLGFDPGGEGAFGWCVADDAASLPLRARASGLASDAREAVGRALDALPPGASVLAAGIDAPLLWSRAGGRAADTAIRRALGRAGYKHSSGTVQSVNSLRGACLVQGMLAAMELRERIATLPLSEAHLKALRWLCHQAKAVSERPSEHERDALLSAFCAWAAAHRPPDWSDLYLNENRWFSPLHQPLHYFMPAIAGA